MENLAFKRRHLTKKEISEAPTMKLIFRMEILHAQSIFNPDKDAGVPMSDIEEAAAIAEELRHTLKGLARLNRRGK